MVGCKGFQVAYKILFMIVKFQSVRFIFRQETVKHFQANLPRTNSKFAPERFVKAFWKGNSSEPTIHFQGKT